MSAAIRTVGVPREVKTAEHRVAMTPDGVRELERHGIQVFVEAGAGEGASITDADYVAAGADDRADRRRRLGRRSSSSRSRSRRTTSSPSCAPT